MEVAGRCWVVGEVLEALVLGVLGVLVGVVH